MKVAEIKAQLKERIAKGLNFGIQAVDEVVEPSAHIYNEYILLQSKYNDLMYMASMNSLAYEQIEIAQNKLRSSLIDLIDRIEPADLGKEGVASDLKISALPTRRDNFFKLLDIHFKNLEAICYVEIYSDMEKRYYGREGIAKFYQSHRWRFRNKEGMEKPEGIQEVVEYFSEFFSSEIGMFEVYIKNIKHLLEYAMESEVEQQFFLDTLRSLFSRFELATMFYYA